MGHKVLVSSSTASCKRLHWLIGHTLCVRRHPEVCMPHLSLLWTSSVMLLTLWAERTWPRPDVRTMRCLLMKDLWPCDRESSIRIKPEARLIHLYWFIFALWAPQASTPLRINLKWEVCFSSSFSKVRMSENGTQEAPWFARWWQSKPRNAFMKALARVCRCSPRKHLSSAQRRR